MSISIAVFPRGSRVRVRRGSLPLDPAVVGRAGLVVEASEYAPHRYGVVLDGDPTLQFFAPAELEAAESPLIAADRERAKRLLPRP